MVLAGGRASRLGGRHKPGITVAGTTLLDRAIMAVVDASEIIVVGPEQPTCRPVRWTVEQPRGGGPVAALAAGLAAASVPAEYVVVLAADLPSLTENTVHRLLAAVAVHDGAVLTDATAHRQWLISAWRTTALQAALPAEPADRSLRAMFADLDIVDVPALPGESTDIDTPADLAEALENSIHKQHHGGDNSPSLRFNDRHRPPE